MTSLKCKTWSQTSQAQAELWTVSVFLQLMDTVLPFCRVDVEDEADKVSVGEESALEDEEASRLVESVQHLYVHVHSKVLLVFC